VAQHIARKFRYRGEPPQDLEQVASLGLILAVDRFEPVRQIDFLSFAVPTITGGGAALLSGPDPHHPHAPPAA